MPRLKWPSAAIAVLALAGCGGVAAIATGASSHASAYATTPTSPGPINPAAVPLGDGYVSTTPTVG
jgi:multidrug efflux pump subunit AcrA (membrane-fusion protein)